MVVIILLIYCCFSHSLGILGTSLSNHFQLKWMWKVTPIIKDWYDKLYCRVKLRVNFDFEQNLLSIVALRKNLEVNLKHMKGHITGSWLFHDSGGIQTRDQQPFTFHLKSQNDDNIRTKCNYSTSLRNHFWGITQFSQSQVYDAMLPNALRLTPKSFFRFVIIANCLKIHRKVINCARAFDKLLC